MAEKKAAMLLNTAKALMERCFADGELQRIQSEGTSGLAADNDLDQALRLLHAAMEGAEDPYEMHAHIASCCIGLKRWEKAAKSAEEGVRVLEATGRADERDSSQAFYLAGTAYEQLNKLQQAHDALERAVTLDPELKVATRMLQTVNQRLAKLAKAEAASTGAIVGTVAQVSVLEAVVDWSHGVVRYCGRTLDPLGGIHGAIPPELRIAPQPASFFPPASAAAFETELRACHQLLTAGRVELASQRGQALVETVASSGGEGKVLCWLEATTLKPVRYDEFKTRAAQDGIVRIENDPHSWWQTLRAGSKRGAGSEPKGGDEAEKSCVGIWSLRSSAARLVAAESLSELGQTDKALRVLDESVAAEAMSSGATVGLSPARLVRGLLLHKAQRLKGAESDFSAALSVCKLLCAKDDFTRELAAGIPAMQETVARELDTVRATLTRNADALLLGDPKQPQNCDSAGGSGSTPTAGAANEGGTPSKARAKKLRQRAKQKRAQVEKAKRAKYEIDSQLIEHMQQHFAGPKKASDSDTWRSLEGRLVAEVMRLNLPLKDKRSRLETLQQGGLSKEKQLQVAESLAQTRSKEAARVRLETATQDRQEALRGFVAKMLDSKSR